ncbi:MAG: protein kinase [Planctomycetota bacterium]
MRKEPKCPECGEPIAADAPGRLCPTCLMRLGLLETDPDVKASGASMEVTTDFVAGVSSTSKTGGDDQDLPRVGETFGGYRLLSMLGQGGMGAVFEAEELETGRIVALKLLKQAIRDREGRKRFFREGRLAASLNHPNSVYVFGTEEIDGTPVISMERVVGGTLEDRIKAEGPMPVAEAVDAILQVIDGLEAAADVGVLHRDIKPSNCFLGESGVVKIGDFGLSISTSGRGDSHLTVEGSFLGTPAFASPEQLRGDELDVRSDIYAVGVTLFYLLTGRTPHHAENMVKLLATVLEQEPPSPRELRPGVPRGLARVVLRCLAKPPGSRFKDYGSLRRALTPYSSVAPSAATLGLRSLAGVIDMAILWPPLVLMSSGQNLSMDGMARLASPDVEGLPWQLPALVATYVMMTAYYAVPEGRYGASIGKAICGLRVIRADGGTPGLNAATQRTLIYYFAPTLIVLGVWMAIAYRIGATGGPRIDLADGLSSAELFSADGMTASEMVVITFAELSVYALLAALFATARRTNRYAAVHDLATQTRVVRTRTARSWTERPKLKQEEEAIPDLDDLPKIGPYYVLRELDASAGRPMWLAYDTRLLRRVWVREILFDEFDPHDSKIDVARVGRLRWIGSWAEGDFRRVAYEALSGSPLPEVLSDTDTSDQPWTPVCYWLFDLATELAAAEADGTLPATLSLDRVWITADGRAKLLDFPAPGVEPTEPVATPQEFLQSVAAAALGWQPDLQARLPNGAFLPVEAVESVQQIGKMTLKETATDLQWFAEKKRPGVSRRRRFAMLAPLLLSFAGGLMLILPAVSAGIVATHRNQDFGEIAPLRDDLAAYFALREQPNSGSTETDTTEADNVRTLNAWEDYIASAYRSVITDELVWQSEKATLLIPETHRKHAEKMVAERLPNFEEFRNAAAIIVPEVSRGLKPFNLGDHPSRRAGEFRTAAILAWLMLVTLPTGLVAMVNRRGWVARGFGVDYVDESGVKADSSRLVLRNFVLPIVGALLLLVALPFIVKCVFVGAYGSIYPTHLVTRWAAGIGAAIVAVLTILSSSMKRRGLHDKLARVYPVTH